MTPNDGGPAFPLPHTSFHDGSHEGMKLRDWFAGMALQGMLTRVEFGEISQYDHLDAIGHAAYVFADAMLTQREAK